MLTADTIKKLKQSNISVNKELTIARSKDVLKSATRAQKNEIDALTGLKRISLNRVYTAGSISAKVAVAIAQILNIDPFYLTGEADERGEYSDKTIKAFLNAKGYGELLIGDASAPAKKRGRTAAQKAKSAEKTVPDKDAALAEKAAPAKKRGRPAAKKATPAEKTVPDKEAAPAEKVAVSKSTPAPVSENKPLSPVDLSNEETVVLLQALSIQARIREDAAITLEKIKALLV